MMKNPYDCDDLEELREIAFYYMQKCKRFEEERSVLFDILHENKINPSMNDVLHKFKRISWSTSRKNITSISEDWKVRDDEEPV